MPCWCAAATVSANGRASLTRSAREVQSGQTADVARLLACGADAKSADGGTIPLVLAAQVRYGSVCRNEARYSLTLSRKHGHCDVAALLIEHGAAVDTREPLSGCTPLYVAAKVRILQWLCAAIMAKCTALLTSRRRQFGHADVVLLLAERGADVNRQAQSGITPLHIAVQVRFCVRWPLNCD